MVKSHEHTPRNQIEQYLEYIMVDPCRIALPERGIIGEEPLPVIDAQGQKLAELKTLQSLSSDSSPVVVVRLCPDNPLQEQIYNYNYGDCSVVHVPSIGNKPLRDEAAKSSLGSSLARLIDAWDHDPGTFDTL